jgi:hypothetical protein
MPKTITLTNTSIQSINLNRDQDVDGKIVGISSMVNYVVHDENGKEITYKTSIKYTSGTDKEGEKMSASAEEKLMAYWNEMAKLMKEREEL